MNSFLASQLGSNVQLNSQSPVEKQEKLLPKSQFFLSFARDFLKTTVDNRRRPVYSDLFIVEEKSSRREDFTGICMPRLCSVFTWAVLFGSILGFCFSPKFAKDCKLV